MKITHLWWSLSYGGIETMLVNILNEQAKLADVSRIIINDMIEPALLHKLTSDINVIKIDRTIGSKNLFFIRKINRILERGNPDVIHLHGSSIFNFLNSKWAAKTCCTLHDIPRGKPGSSNRWLSIAQWCLDKDKGNVRCCNRIKHIFSISNSVSEVLLRGYGITSEVVFNGIVPEKFYHEVRRRGERKLRMVQVSRLDHHKKGQDLLIQALLKLRQQGEYNIELTLIGDGESRVFLQEMVNENNMGKEVHFLGSQSQDYIAEHLADYDLFVQPSRYEGFGLTVAEAMAAGVPVLVSSNQGPAEVIENGKYGWIFENEDSADLARMIMFLLSHEEKVFQKAQLAQKYVDEKYNVKTTAYKYFCVYQDVF